MKVETEEVRDAQIEGCDQFGLITAVRQHRLPYIGLPLISRDRRQQLQALIQLTPLGGAIGEVVGVWAKVVTLVQRESVYAG